MRHRQDGEESKGRGQKENISPTATSRRHKKAQIVITHSWIRIKPKSNIMYEHTV